MCRCDFVAIDGDDTLANCLDCRQSSIVRFNNRMLLVDHTAAHDDNIPTRITNCRNPNRQYNCVQPGQAWICKFGVIVYS